MNGKTIRATIYLVVFAIITALLTYVLAVTISNGSVGSTESYKAEFTDTTGLLKGDDVRIAGVRVGQVLSTPKVKLNCQSTNPATGVTTVVPACSMVKFGLLKSIPLESNATIDVKYLNLVGQRYLDVVQTPDSASALPKDAMVPLERTVPALDLTTLFDGFKPLFQALDPADTNAIAYEVVSTLQGEGGNLDSLLASTASLSTSIASQDSAIGSLIDNLTGVLATVDTRDGELTNLIDQLQRLVTGVAGDKDAIASSLGNINLLATSTSNLIATIRPYLPTDLSQLSGVANYLATTTTINQQGQRQNELDEFINRYPTKITTITRTATYGGFFNFYLCRINAVIGTTSVAVQSNNSAVCDQP
jgi:phospholipid/cholesterol/gamma-HCH transport system substrate-binding protein